MASGQVSKKSMQSLVGSFPSELFVYMCTSERYLLACFKINRLHHTGTKQVELSVLGTQYFTFSTWHTFSAFGSQCCFLLQKTEHRNYDKRCSFALVDVTHWSWWKMKISCCVHHTNNFCFLSPARNWDVYVPESVPLFHISTVWARRPTYGFTTLEEATKSPEKSYS